MSGQGSPPGRNPTGIELNVLVGDAKAGETYFARRLLEVPFGDRRPQGHRREVLRPARAAERVGRRVRAAAFGGGGGGRGGAAGAGNPATVTMADGSKLEGTLVRKDDWLVILTLPDGTRKSMARSNGVPKVDVKDPKDPHKTMVLELDDPENKKMHDVTAYLCDDQVEARQQTMKKAAVFVVTSLLAGSALLCRAERQPGSPRRHARPSGLEGPDAPDLAGPSQRRRRRPRSGGHHPEAAGGSVDQLLR